MAVISALSGHGMLYYQLSEGNILETCHPRPVVHFYEWRGQGLVEIQCTF